MCQGGVTGEEGSWIKLFEQLLHFFRTLLVILFFIGCQLSEDPKKFSYVLSLLIGHIHQDRLYLFIIRGLFKLHVQLNGLVFRGDTVADRPNQLSVGKFSIQCQSCKRVVEFRHVLFLVSACDIDGSVPRFQQRARPQTRNLKPHSRYI